MTTPARSAPPSPRGDDARPERGSDRDVRVDPVLLGLLAGIGISVVASLLAGLALQGLG